MRLVLTLLAALLGLGVLAAGALLVFASPGDVIGTQDEMAFGDDITDAQRETVAGATGLDLAPSTVWHAYTWHASLDQSLSALVAMPVADAQALLARPPLDAALWRVTADVPTLHAALGEWPTWPTTGETESGRSTTIDLAPGRTLSVYVGEADPTTRTLRLSWQTY